MTISGAGDYLWNVIPMGFWIDGEPERQWQSWWTIFYWGWWIAWCPFVGLFIARVSKGRTIRQFCFCVLLVPTSVVILWMGIFGSAATGVDLFNRRRRRRCGQCRLRRPACSRRSPASAMMLW